MCKIRRWELSTHQQHNSHQRTTPVGIPIREESLSQSHHGLQDHQPPGLYTTRLSHSLSCTISDKRSPIEATYSPSHTDLYKSNIVASSSVLWNGLDAEIRGADHWGVPGPTRHPSPHQVNEPLARFYNCVYPVFILTLALLSPTTLLLFFYLWRAHATVRDNEDCMTSLRTILTDTDISLLRLSKYCKP